LPDTAIEISAPKNRRRGKRRNRFLSALLALVAGITTIVVVGLPSTAFASYSGTNAAQYADKWWNSYNSNYYKFNGDDCTNFVSQALHDPYGGGGMDYVGGSSSTDDSQWWMHYSSLWGFSWSHSFTVAQDLYNFLLIDWPGGFPEGTAHTLAEQEAEYTPDSVVTGDVLFYDWDSDGHQDHAGIQVGIGTDPNSGWYGNYQDQHSNNRKHAFWSLIPYNSQWATTTISYFHIDASNP
jgi:hypothetical protein